ncbi:MAG: MATE family efflux transporter [Eubacteriales bacterium]
MFSYMKQDQGFYKQTARLTLPIILQNIISSTLSMADTFMVGILGEAQMAALTLANIPFFVIVLYLFGVQNGSGILISQYWGKGDTDSIHKVVGISMWLSIIVTGLIAVAVYAFPVEFMSLFGNDPEVVELAAGYGKIIGFSYFLNGFTLMYSGAYRSMGQPKLGMYLLGVSMMLNLFLNWVFIYGNLGFEAMGVKGAALATLMARGLEVVIMVFHGFCGKNNPLKLTQLFSFHKPMAKKFFKYCLPVVFNETAWGMGTSVAPTVMGHMAGSTEILAAYALASNMEKLVMVAGFGIGASSGIIIGNAIGAGSPKEKILPMGHCLGMMGFLIGSVSGLCLWLFTLTLFPLSMAPMFKLSLEATKIAQIMLYFLAIMMGLRTFNTVAVVGVFRAGGDSKKSMFVDLIPLWCVAIPVTVLSGTALHLSIFWVVMAMKLEDLVKFFVGLYFIRSDAWIHDVT